MNDFTLSLQITAIGMGLVFGAIIVLWLTMILLTVVTTDKTTETLIVDPVQETKFLAQAAAIGVAIAIAEQQLSSAHPLNDPPTAIISAWQLGMRTRQMTQKGERHR